MSASALEAFLTLLYVDAVARARFLADPFGEATRAGLDPDDCRALGAVDRSGLELAARSFARKRAAGGARPRPAAGWRRLAEGLRRVLRLPPRHPRPS